MASGPRLADLGQVGDRGGALPRVVRQVLLAQGRIEVGLLELVEQRFELRNRVPGLGTLLDRARQGGVRRLSDVPHQAGRVAGSIRTALCGLRCLNDGVVQRGENLLARREGGLWLEPEP